MLRRFALYALLALSLTAVPVVARPAPDSFADLADKLLPSVVNIATETVLEYHEWYDTMLRQFYGWPRTPVHQEKSVSLGSVALVTLAGRPRICASQSRS